MWSDAHLKERLARRAAELGISFSQLLAAAGMQRDAFRDDRPPKTARRLDSLIALAQACKWSLAELMGHDVLSRINPDYAATAAATAERALQQVLTPEQQKAVFWRIFARIYDILAARERDGLPAITPADLELIEKLVAAEFRDRPLAS